MLHEDMKRKDRGTKGSNKEYNITQEKVRQDKEKKEKGLMNLQKADRGAKRGD